jgi:hypothetical protein
MNLNFCSAGPSGESTNASSIGRFDDDYADQSAKRMRSETTSHEIDRDLQRHRIEAQDSDTAPPLDDAGVGALNINGGPDPDQENKNDEVGESHADTTAAAVRVSAYSGLNKMSTSSQDISDDEDWYMAGPPDEVVVGKTPKESIDLVNRVRGLYRILDLVGETGSNGLGTRQPFLVFFMLLIIPSLISRQNRHLSNFAWAIHQRSLSGCLLISGRC